MNKIYKVTWYLWYKWSVILFLFKYNILSLYYIILLFIIICRYCRYKTMKNVEYTYLLRPTYTYIYFFHIELKQDRNKLILSLNKKYNLYK